MTTGAVYSSSLNGALGKGPLILRTSRLPGLADALRTVGVSREVDLGTSGAESHLSVSAQWVSGQSHVPCVGDHSFSQHLVYRDCLTHFVPSALAVK
mgnify:CR=1 FL=1